MDAWALVVPPGMSARTVNPPPECTSMAHVRGEIAPGAPATAIVSTRAGVTVSRLAQTLAEACLTPARSRTATIPGATHAARVDGLIEMEEGVSQDGIERIAIVVAERGSGVVVLTVRTRPSDGVMAEVEALIASFEIR